MPLFSRSSRSSPQEPRWQDGELYLGGNKLPRASGLGSSRAASPTSVLSAYDSHSARVPPSRAASYPVRSEPSRQMSRFTTGYPTTLYGGASQGSAPALNANRHDHYREAIEPKPGNYGPARDSPFNRTYDDYKNRDTAAVSAEHQYKDYLKSTPRISKKQASSNPGKYVGDPKQTKEWHSNAAGFAERGKVLYQEAIDARTKMSHDFIGYDKYKSAQKHKERTDILVAGRNYMDKKSSSHRDSSRR